MISCCEKLDFIWVWIAKQAAKKWYREDSLSLLRAGWETTREGWPLHLDLLTWRERGANVKTTTTEQCPTYFNFIVNCQTLQLSVRTLTTFTLYKTRLLSEIKSLMFAGELRVSSYLSLKSVPAHTRPQQYWRKPAWRWGRGCNY